MRLRAERYLSNPFQGVQPLAVACYLLVAVLFLLCELSRADCSLVLISLNFILELSATQHSLPAHQTKSLVQTVPLDIRTVLDTLKLRPSYRTYISCPECHALYQEKSCPQECTSQRTKLSPICGATLKKTQVIRSKTYSMAINHFHYHELKEWLGEFLCRPGMETILDRDPPPDDGRDILGSRMLREIKDMDGKPFLAARGTTGRYVFTLAMDGFNPWRNKVAGKKDSVGGIYMICLNLPPAQRYLPENMFLVGVMPAHPSLEEINHFLTPLVDDLHDFYNPGVYYSRTPVYPQGRNVNIIIAPLICDLLAARQMAGYASFSMVKFFCSFCLLNLNNIENLDRTTWGTRSWQEHLRWATQWRDANSETERQKLFEDHGVRWSELLRLPYWNPLIFTIIDLMHALFLGNFKRHIRDTWGMDVALIDGDGSFDDSPNGPTALQIEAGKAVFRSGTDEELGRITAAVLRQIAKDEGERYPKKKSSLLRILRSRVRLLYFLYTTCHLISVKK